jgi:hypothetical protein
MKSEAAADYPRDLDAGFDSQSRTGHGLRLRDLSKLPQAS